MVWDKTLDNVLVFLIQGPTLIFSLIIERCAFGSLHILPFLLWCSHDTEETLWHLTVRWGEREVRCHRTINKPQAKRSWKNVIKGIVSNPEIPSVCSQSNIKCQMPKIPARPIRAPSDHWILPSKNRRDSRTYSLPTPLIQGSKLQLSTDPEPGSKPGARPESNGGWTLLLSSGRLLFLLRLPTQSLYPIWFWSGVRGWACVSGSNTWSSGLNRRTWPWNPLGREKRGSIVHHISWTVRFVKP